MAKDQTRAARSNDTSSFVEHLRFVHFALVAACMVFCIAVTSQTLSNAARAYEQTNQLLRLNDLWNHGEWLRNFISKQHEATTRAMSLSEQRSRAVELIDPPPLFDLEFRFPQNHAFVALGDPKYNWRLANAPLGMTSPQALSIDAFTSTIADEYQPNRLGSSFGTLADVIRIWDRLNDFRNLIILTKLGEGWLIIHGVDRSTRKIGNFVIKLRESSTASTSSDGTLTTLSSPGLLTRDDLIQLLKFGPYRPGEARLAGPDPRVEAYETLLQLVFADTNTHCFFFDSTQLALLRATCASVRVSPQSAFSSTLQFPPAPGIFRERFPILTISVNI